MPGKQLLVAVLLGNLESPSAYRFEREWAGCRWEEPGREPGRGEGGGGVVINAPKGTALQELGQV